MKREKILRRVFFAKMLSVPVTEALVIPMSAYVYVCSPEDACTYVFA